MQHRGAVGSHKVSMPYVSKPVEDLLLWRDPKTTGIVFGGITAAYIVLDWLEFSLVSLLCKVLLGAVVVSFAWNNIASFSNRPGVPVPRVVREGISERELKSFAERTTPVINKFLAFTHRLISGRDILFTVQVAVALLVLAKVTTWLDTLDLLYTVTFLAFTLPKIYELKKDEIDSVVHKVSHEVRLVYNKHVAPVVAKIPKGGSSTTTSHTTSSHTIGSHGSPADHMNAAAGHAQAAAQDFGNRAAAAFNDAIPQEGKKGL